MFTFISTLVFSAALLQSSEPVHGPVGRYQLTANSAAKIYMLDTVTGRVWEQRYGNQAWVIMPRFDDESSFVEWSAVQEQKAQR